MKYNKTDQFTKLDWRYSPNINNYVTKMPVLLSNIDLLINNA